ncbi:MBOAT family O-acyltransferase [Alteromonas lipolytica]|uniref:MBOAT family O-acyltransferase n=1 Tax=Alteromonas lipolytica TaxID=1856405 RepID=UPI0015861046|nr:alginate O-acetylation protein [Alteromonas lipolytica]
MLRNKQTGKKILVIGTIFNLSVIGYYKYAFFASDIFNSVFDSNWFVAEKLLPVGISFYTFQQIAFLVDTYKYGNTQYKLSHYSLFVLFFPQLIAGPIVHHSQLMPQIASLNKKLFNWDMFNIGLLFLCVGVFKKIILADTFARIANPVFASVDNGATLSMTDSWLGAIAYTLQLYFDFSAYSEMAIGLGLMFGVKLPLNFFSPYKAASIVEFWRRWHMTLSAFLRDYLYIPLGGNQKGKFRKYINLFLTMLLGGLWHGAGWGFIFWGALHGTYLIINHFSRYCGLSQYLPKTFSIIITFIAVVFAWVFFRAESLDGAINMIIAMVALTDTPNQFFIPYQLFFIFCGLGIVFGLPNVNQTLNYEGVDTPTAQLTEKWKCLSIKPGIAFALGGLVGLTIMFMPEPTVFIYFNF